ncbi:motile sperm domain-containing protein 2 [Megalopta genalis]|uniref:motile sperm domain-containing protein 2 n=1 Tax=Megalopta genalis TaxID=115081 RepID=UPI00144383CD|nr:motile sperm domain-containing protein 2-like [Megalopta genalis]
MMEVRPELLTELSEKFSKKLLDTGISAPDFFHPADIARVEKKSWLKRFLEHNDCNVDEALNMLWQTCIWRKTFGANELTEDVVKREYLEDGLCFIHGHDRDGKTMFVIRCKLYTKKGKDYEELQKVVVYWFERLERHTNGDQISLFFDMADTGISNLDMNFIEYMTGLCKNYYPNFLNYIIIFEMPWILEAAFKVIKSWLPPKAIPKIKFVQKNSIQEYVNQSDILISWGGSNDYTFQFVPEAQTNAEATMNGRLDNKKVHFAEGSPLLEQSPISFGEQGDEEELLLSVEPKTIAFTKTGNETAGTITLKNITTDKPLFYKVKTTSPEKFRVRSSSGVILAQTKRVISVVLQPGYNLRNLLHNDRFLVMCLPLKDANTSAQEIAALWKSEIKPEEHKLRCCDGDADSNDKLKPHSILSGMSESRTMDALFHNVAQLKESNARLRSDVTFLKYSQLFSIIVTIVMAMLVVYVLRIDSNNGPMEQDDCHIPHI